ncbi:MAG: hypothetical protein C3F02_01530 [Parcubacteria group bacterium]|nr:MAG: hypothetical protein C3F02_01530 [Parcubacteria group bacterium]
MKIKLANPGRRPIYVWLIFLSATLVLYGAGMHIYFLSDDWHWLYLGQERAIDGSLFLSNYAGQTGDGSYNPFLFLIFKLFYVLFGLKFWAYHLISILVHATNGLLVYLLARKLFVVGQRNIAWFWPVIIGAMFIVWPNQVETVTWLSAWAHLWPTFFFLLSLLSYLHFRSSSRRFYLFLSVLLFTIAIFTKETTLSLPFIILVNEMFLGRLCQTTRPDYLRVRYFFYILLFFLLLRYGATGMCLGYYMAPVLGLDPLAWIARLAIYGSELVSFGFLRILLSKIVYHYQLLVAILVLLFLAGSTYGLYVRKKFFLLAVAGSLLIALGPFLLLDLHRTTFADERYLYLPSVFFVIGLGYILSFWPRRYWPRTILIVIGIICLGVVRYKLDIWQQAGRLSQQTLASYGELKLAPDQKLVAVGLPDNLAGAQLWRNNLSLALDFIYPVPVRHQITMLPVYVQLNKDNQDKHLLNWRQDELGWFGESADGSFVVTGLTSLTRNGFYWELWNYNYQNYTANTIRLMPQTEKLKDSLGSGQIKIFTFDRGRFRILE